MGCFLSPACDCHLSGPSLLVLSPAPPGKRFPASPPRAVGNNTPFYLPFWAAPALMPSHAAPVGPHRLCQRRASVRARGPGMERSMPLGERGKTPPPLNSSLLMAKGTYLVGFWTEAAQTGEAALNLSLEAARGES